MLTELLQASLQTLYMVLGATLLASLIGIPLGVLTAVSSAKHLWPQALLQKSLDFIINIGRSIPFIILLIAVIPLTRLLVGSSIGTQAAMVPLTLGAIPFIARTTENAILSVPKGLLEAGQAMGATVWQIIYRCLLPESWPGIINGIILTAIALVGYSAMAGVVGGGGLGDLAIRYGYQRFDTKMMLITVILLILLVQILQYLGNKVYKYVHKG